MLRLFVSLTLVLALWPLGAQPAGIARADELHPTPREYVTMMEPCLPNAAVRDGPGESIVVDLRTAHGWIVRSAKFPREHSDALIFWLDEPDEETPLTLYLERMQEPPSRYNWLTWRDDSAALVGCFSTTYEIRRWAERHP